MKSVKIMKEKIVRRCQNFRDLPRKQKIKESLVLLGIVLVCAIGFQTICYSIRSPIGKWITEYKWFLRMQDASILEKVETPSGATLLFISGNRRIYNSIEVVWEDGTGQVENVSVDLIPRPGEKPATKIFYKEGISACNSFMKKVITPNGVDFVILISHDTPFNTREMRYEYTQWCGVVPYDTLDSEIVEVHYRKIAQYYGTEATYPVFLLVLPYDEIPEDYELHFGNYVLTYEDIKTQTWAPPLESDRDGLHDPS